MEPEAVKFYYFSQIHIHTFIVSVLFSIFLLLIPKFFKKIDLRNYGTFLGFFILGFKILDSVYRVMQEHEPAYNVIPIHLCNFAAIAAGLYLIFKTCFLFNLTYFLSFGAAFALVLPGVVVYYHPFYVYVFMIMHALEFVAVLYGFIYLKDKIDFKGYMMSSVTLILLFIYASIYNLFFPVNAMFLKTYIAPIVSFIKPFEVYIVVLIFSMLLIMFLMHLPFRKKNMAFKKYCHK